MGLDQHAIPAPDAEHRIDHDQRFGLFGNDHIQFGGGPVGVGDAQVVAAGFEVVQFQRNGGEGADRVFVQLHLEGREAIANAVHRNPSIGIAEAGGCPSGGESRDLIGKRQRDRHRGIAAVRRCAGQ